MKRLVTIALVLLVVGAGAIYWLYRTDLDAARAHVAAGSRVANTACGPIEYASGGSGPAVLAIHGAGGGYTQMSAFARALEQAGFRVISMSRFGYLGTPLPSDASPEAQADAHACLLDALGVRAAAAVGVSAGAPSAMQFCIRRRERCTALVLLVPAAYYEGRAARETTPPSPFMQVVIERVLTSDFVMWTVTRVAPRLLIETALATPIEDYRAAAPAEQQRARALIDDILPVSAKVRGLMNDTAIASSLPRYELEKIAAPTLVISVENDLYGTAANARYTARYIAGARVVVYPDGGHVWLGHDAEVMSEIRGFLTSSGLARVADAHLVRH